MDYNLNQIFDDHAEFVLTKLIIAGSCVSDKAWASIRGCLASSYKFSVDKSTFAGTLGRDVAVIPAGHPLFRTMPGNSSKAMELFVRYDFMNGQDAAIREMLLTTKKLGWDEHFSSSLDSTIHHRFASSANPNQVTGVISLNLPVDSKILYQFKKLYHYCIKTHHTRDEYLQKLKEISNEQG